MMPDRRGVMDLPIRLMVVVIVLSVSVPLIADAAEINEKSMMTADMNREIGVLMNAVSAVHYSGIGSSRTVDIDLPAGCEMTIGGPDTAAYSVRMFFNGEHTATAYFEKPAVMIFGEVHITADSTLMLTSMNCDGRFGIGVTVL